VSDDDDSSPDAFFDGLRTLVDGARRVRRAVPGVLAAFDGVVDQLADPAAVDRVVSAGVGAVARAVVHEVRAGAARPPRPPAPEPAPPLNVLFCRLHGEHPWKGTIVCTAAHDCGRVYQVLDATAAHAAPIRCPCGAVTTTSCKPICSVCFEGIVASGGRAVRRTST
jgi:hypothetical protein